MTAGPDRDPCGARGCATCNDLMPRTGEPFAAFLARVGALYRAAASATTPCGWCGAPIASRPDHPARWCSQRCRSRADRAGKRGAA